MQDHTAIQKRNVLLPDAWIRFGVGVFRKQNSDLQNSCWWTYIKIWIVFFPSKVETRPKLHAVHLSRIVPWDQTDLLSLVGIQMVHPVQSFKLLARDLRFTRFVVMLSHDFHVITIKWWFCTIGNFFVWTKKKNNVAAEKMASQKNQAASSSKKSMFRAQNCC